MRYSLALLLAAALPIAACGNKQDPAPSAAASGAASSTAAAAQRKPGEMPFDFPSGPTTAKAGDYVLAPSKNWIDDAFKKGGDKQTFIYYAAKMVEPGPLESKIKTLPGQEVTVPNGFILPIKSGQRAKPGDVLLTWWQSGSGMQRSIVVGGSEEEPKVVHLDMDLDNPSGSAKKEDTLKKDSFHKLGPSLEPGVTVAVKDGKGHKHWIVTSVAGDKVLVIGFAGAMRVFRKGDCTVVPPQGSFAAGQDVAVPHMGTYYKGKVDKVDAKIGRVFAKFSWGGGEKTIGFGLPSVSPVLPGM